MKKLMILLTLSFLSVSAFSQEKIQDEFIKEGNLIKATLYHDNGTVAQTGYYTKGNQLQGDWISYDAQGNKTAEATYNNGLKIGTWTFYNGTEKKEVTYKDARIAEIKTWTVTDTRVVSN